MEYAFSNSEMATVHSCLLANRCEHLAETEYDHIFIFDLYRKEKRIRTLRKLSNNDLNAQRSVDFAASYAA